MVNCQMNYSRIRYFHKGIFVILFSLLTLSGFGNALDKQEIDAIISKVKETPIPVAAKGEEYILDTNFGQLTIILFTETAPLHAANFKRLVIAKYFDKTQFHRIINGYIIQGGDILTRDRDPANDGTGGPGYSLKNEFNNLKHEKGIISMARGTDPDSAGSQFFIVLGDAPFLDNKYTVFGKVIKGLDVLDKIASVPVTYSTFNERSKPILPVVLNTVIFVAPKDLKSDPKDKSNVKDTKENKKDNVKDSTIKKEPDKDTTKGKPQKDELEKKPIKKKKNKERGHQR